MKSILRIVLIVVAVLAIVFYFIFNDAYVNKRRINCTAVTTGQIIEFKDPIVLPTRRSRSKPDNSIVARYEVNGISYECRGRTPKWMKTGDEVQVYYSPSDPSLAYCGEGPRSKVSAGMVGIGSAVTGLMGVAAGAMRGHRSRRYGSMSTY